MTKQRKRRRVPHICAKCGQVRHLQPFDAVRTKLCRRCHCRQIAALGFAATARTKGPDFAIWAAAAKRKQCPSTLEQKVEAALCEIGGIVWEREYPVEREGFPPYFVDFAVMVGKRRVALEVNGTYVHRNDNHASVLRLDTLLQCFDAVVVLTEAEVLNTVDLPKYVTQLISRSVYEKGVM